MEVRDAKEEEIPQLAWIWFDGWQDAQSLRPLISWVQAGEWTEIASDFALGDAKDLLPCPVQCSADTFVLRVRGESMEPKFHDGELIFVDPQVAPVSGRYVVVRLEDPQGRASSESYPIVAA
ncbi:MAG: S24 family peptidase [Gammaproteobacteria bacterium]